mgnify:CR=1 FL=1
MRPCCKRCPRQLRRCIVVWGISDSGRSVSDIRGEGCMCDRRRGTSWTAHADVHGKSADVRGFLELFSVRAPELAPLLLLLMLTVPRTLGEVHDGITNMSTKWLLLCLGRAWRRCRWSAQHAYPA